MPFGVAFGGDGVAPFELFICTGTKEETGATLPLVIGCKTGAFGEG